MIPLSESLYVAALSQLQTATTGGYLGRLVQIFLACKYYGDTIPRIGAATGIESRNLERLLDTLYEKPTRAPTSIAMIFSNNHLAPTGVTAPGLSYPSNIWRNNFNLQKGFGCYATTQELLDPSFRAQPRISCPHLRPIGAVTLAKSTCELTTTGAEYRNEDHAKIFQIDAVGRDFKVLDPSSIADYAPIVQTPKGQRLPVVPLIVALYFDSALAAGRTQIDTGDFATDFGFTAAEYGAYFDDDPSRAENKALADAFAGVSWTQFSTSAVAATKTTLSLPPPKLTKPPAGSRWWDAEQAVRTVLEGEGWFVIDRSRQSAGFDFEVSRGADTFFVEVKSSGGLCAPVLTENEYRQAVALKDKYVVAVVENFDPDGAVLIQWVASPASLGLSVREVKTYPVPRAKWLPTARDQLK